MAGVRRRPGAPDRVVRGHAASTREPRGGKRGSERRAGRCAVDVYTPLVQEEAHDGLPEAVVACRQGGRLHPDPPIGRSSADPGQLPAALATNCSWPNSPHDPCSSSRGRSRPMGCRMRWHRIGGCARVRRKQPNRWGTGRRRSQTVLARRLCRILRPSRVSPSPTARLMTWISQ